ncbi:MAG: hypothetical protein JWN52_3970 [Actinomycetia bacterium]|nr:hypothetical protein [Actinomycetes bacterium]
MKRPSILLAVVPALALTACGGTSSNTGVASAGGGKVSAGATAKVSTDPQEAQIKYARCLRAHGINMPDNPKDVPSGGLAISDQAEAACKQFQPPGKPIDASDPKTHDRLVKLARCMRGDGFDWPDPAPGSLGGPPPGYDGGSNKAKWQQSLADCQKSWK